MSRHPQSVTTDASPAFLDTRQLSSMTGLSTAFLAKLRSSDPAQSPPWLKCGERVLYPREAFNDWVEARLVGGSGAAR